MKLKPLSILLISGTLLLGGQALALSEIHRSPGSFAAAPASTTPADATTPAPKKVKKAKKSKAAPVAPSKAMQIGDGPR